MKLVIHEWKQLAQPLGVLERGSASSQIGKARDSVLSFAQARTPNPEPLTSGGGSATPGRRRRWFEEGFDFAQERRTALTARVAAQGCAQRLELCARDLVVADPCVGHRPEGVVGGGDPPGKTSRRPRQG
ncbi:MAG: hypothetical protein ACE10G_07290, partial [Gemmatimonadales bacterium]